MHFHLIEGLVQALFESDKIHLGFFELRLQGQKNIFIGNPLVLQLLHCNWIQQHARGILHKNVAGIWPHETSDTHLQSIWWVFLQDLGYTCILCPIPYEMWTLHTWWSLKLCSIQLWGVGMDLNLYPSATGIQQHTKLSHNDYIYWKKRRNKHPSIPSPNCNLAQPSLNIIKNNLSF